MRRLLATATAGLLALGVCSTVASAATPEVPDASSSYNGLSLTPPMGFNDWNAFGCNVSADLIKQTALAMHNNGMQAAGYEYVNIDDCWMNGRDLPKSDAAARAAAGRDADGRYLPDPTYFPPSAAGLTDGIKVVADYVHSLGLKLGIYTDVGTATCQGLAGQYKGPSGANYATIDAQTFADWGVDYIKDDWCNVPLGDVPGVTRDDKAEFLYKAMSDAVRAVDRPMIFQAATLGDGGLSTWNWAPAISNLWRTTGDISASYSSMLSNFTKNSQLAAFTGPGHWNDPDMLEIGTGSFSTLSAAASPGDTSISVASASRATVGAVVRVGTAAGGNLESATVTGVSGTTISLDKPLTKSHASGEQVNKDGLTAAESRTHFSLWAMEAAPMLAGTDVVNMAPDDLAIYTNHDVTAVDQDPLGIQAKVETNADGHWVLTKPLADGSLAVALFNANNTAWSNPSASLDSVGLDSSQSYTATELWSKKTGVAVGSINAGDLAPHATALYKVTAAAGSSPEEIQTTVTQQGGLTISVENNGPVVLPNPTLTSDGTELATSGDMNPLTVTDTRTQSPGWNVVGQVSNFADGVGDSIDASALGWEPKLIDQADGEVVNTGAVVEPNTNGGLGQSQQLASADAGSSRGTAHVGATLNLRAPTSTQTGTYTATLTLTAI